MKRKGTEVRQNNVPPKKERKITMKEERISPKKGKDALYIACLNVAKNLLCAEMLNKDYVSYKTLSEAMLATSTVVVRRLLDKLGYGKVPYSDSKDDEERAEILYENLKVFQLAGLKDYANELKTKQGKEKAKHRLVRGKFPNGYKTKKKLEEKQKQEEIEKAQAQAQRAFDEMED